MRTSKIERTAVIASAALAFGSFTFGMSRAHAEEAHSNEKPKSEVTAPVVPECVTLKQDGEKLLVDADKCSDSTPVALKLPAEVNKVKVSGKNGDVNITDINLPSIEVEVREGLVTLEGSSPKASVEVSSGGKLAAQNLISNEVTVKASGNSKVDVFAKEVVNVSCPDKAQVSAAGGPVSNLDMAVECEFVG